MALDDVPSYHLLFHFSCNPSIILIKFMKKVVFHKRIIIFNDDTSVEIWCL